VTISDRVGVIDDDCFSGCESLPEIDFEHGSKLLLIESRAIQYCARLDAISSPASLKYLGERSFYQRVSLVSVSFDAVAARACHRFTFARLLEGSEGVVLLSHRNFWKSLSQSRLMFTSCTASRQTAPAC
jgi:hypothetical protein